MSAKERLLEFIKFKKITPSRFEKMCKLANGYLRSLRHSPTLDKMQTICSTFPDLNPDWLRTGEGTMLRTPLADDPTPLTDCTPQTLKPFIPATITAAAAGTLDGFPNSVDLRLCEFHPYIPAFGKYDFSMIILGHSMEPEFYSGDEIFLRRIQFDEFRNNRTYVISTSDGSAIKRLTLDHATGEIVCHSLNPEYTSYRLPSASILAIYHIVGLARTL